MPGASGRWQGGRALAWRLRGRAGSLAGRVVLGGIAVALALGGAAPGAARAGTMAVPACGYVARQGGAAVPSAVPVSDAVLPAPEITARAAVVIDGETGRVLYSRNADQQLRPASTTKILTAILAIEQGNLDRTVVSDIDSRLLPDSSVMGLRPGVPITVRDLLYGLMLPSGNDAAIELAEAVDGSVPAFVERMDRKLADLGLRESNFTNPHGLDARRQYSSAYDLAMLARYAMANEEFARIVGTRAYRLAPPSDYDLYNGNSLLDQYPGVDGVKIGWTERADWTLVASAVRDGRRIFVTVLGSQDRNADASALLDWTWQSYRWVRLGAGTDQLVRIAQRVGGGEALVRALTVCS